MDKISNVQGNLCPCPNNIQEMFYNYTWQQSEANRWRVVKKF